MNHRRLARAYAFQTIYSETFNSESTQETMLDQFEVPGKAKAFAEQLINGVAAEQEMLDAVLQEFSPKRKMDRFPKVELSILRMGAWELLHPQPDTPFTITINEAVILAKEYGGENSYKYINAILHNLSKSSQ